VVGFLIAGHKWYEIDTCSVNINGHSYFKSAQRPPTALPLHYCNLLIQEENSFLVHINEHILQNIHGSSLCQVNTHQVYKKASILNSQQPKQ